MLLSELPCRIKGDAADATIPWHLLPSEVIGQDPEGGAEGKCRPERHFHQNRFLGAGKSCVEHGRKSSLTRVEQNRVGGYLVGADPHQPKFPRAGFNLGEVCGKNPH
jgi:hypothetical protein